MFQLALCNALQCPQPVIISQFHVHVVYVHDIGDFHLMARTPRIPRLYEYDLTRDQGLSLIHI